MPEGKKEVSAGAKRAAIEITFLGTGVRNLDNPKVSQYAEIIDRELAVESPWVSGQEPPKASGEYLTYSNNGLDGWVMCQHWNSVERKWRYESHVTHWMEKPAPPTEGQ